MRSSKPETDSKIFRFRSRAKPEEGSIMGANFALCMSVPARYMRLLGAIARAVTS